MNKADVVFDLPLITDSDATVVLQASIEPFNLPAAFEASELATILCLGLDPIRAMRRNHLDAAPGEQGIQLVTVIGAIANQTLGFMRDKTGSKCGLNELGFMRRSTRYVNGDRKASAVCNCHNLATFAPLGLAHALAPFLAETKVPSMKHSDRSKPPRSYKSCAKVFRICSKTPALTQAWKWRWHVEPGGYRPGMSCQAAPVRMIHQMPFITSLGSRAGRPRPSSRLGRSGINGLINVHCASVRSIVPVSPFQIQAVLPFLR
jgi:hypothetical protein